MNLMEAIQTEHSKAMSNKVVRWVGNSQDRFNKLLILFLEGSDRMQQRSAWSVSYCVENNPKLILPHLSGVIRNLRRPNLHNAIKRNTVRLLQFVRVPKGLQGEVADICFAYVSDGKEAAATRCFSMSVLAHIVRKVPELRRELQLILEDLLPYVSSGVASRAKRILKELRSEKGVAPRII